MSEMIIKPSGVKIVLACELFMFCQKNKNRDFTIWIREHCVTAEISHGLIDLVFAYFRLDKA